MNAIQKGVVIIGLIAIALSVSMAPYRVTYSVETLSPIVYSFPAPLWGPPKYDDRASEIGESHTVELETGKLALTWGAIGLVTLALVALASKREKA